jgi:uncharacterized protein
LRLGAATAGGALTAALGLGGYAYAVEPGRFDLARLKVAVRRLPPAFEGLTIAQLSDLHLAASTPADTIARAVELVLAERPDVVALTGDYISQSRRGEAGLLSELLAPLTAPAGLFAVLGNHDNRGHSRVVIEALERAGFTVLGNAHAFVERGGQRLYFAGVDSVLSGRHDLARALRGLPDAACAVLLAHEPDFADTAGRDPRLVLQLSGHSHGGQVRIPRLPRVLPRLARKYPEGLYQVGGLKLYTTRGVGVTDPPIRINCPPEITLLELTRAEG